MSKANPLLAYREKHGLTQQEVADKLGVSRALVGMLETGAKHFTADMAILIEKKLGIDRAAMRPDYFKRQAA